jgi:hypothetical protein
MDPTKITNNTKSSKPTDTTTSEPTKHTEIAGKPADPKTSTVPSEFATSKDTNAKSSKKDEGTKVLSVAFPRKTVRQLKLLSSIEGVSIASIVVSSVTRSVGKRLPGALETLKNDLEG